MFGGWKIQCRARGIQYIAMQAQDISEFFTRRSEYYHEPRDQPRVHAEMVKCFGNMRRRRVD